MERTVRAAIESAANGTPTVLDIMGPSGFGKSTLARWVAREFPAEQIRRATALENDQADTLGVLRQLDPDLGDGDPNPLRMAARLGRHIDALQLTGPVVLLIDDVQWADPESIDALAVLLERMAGDRVLVVTAHRPSGAGHLRWTAAAARAPRVDRVSLEGLDDVGTLAMIRQRHPDVDPVLAPRLREHTGGSPLFTQSLLHEYAPADLLRLSEHGSLPAPGDLAESLRHRLTGLDQELVDVLEALAVLGDAGADVFVVAAVAGARDIDRTLARLHSERLVVLTADPVRRARLAHGALRAAIYENIEPTTRRDLHGRAAARVSSRRARLEHRLAAATTADDGLAADLDAFADELHGERQFRQAARIRRKAAFVTGSLDERTRRERGADFESILALDIDDVSTDENTAGSDPLTRFTFGARMTVERDYASAASALESLTDAELDELDDLTAYRARVLRAWATISAGRSEVFALADLEAAQRLPRHDPALDAYFSISHGQATYAVTPPEGDTELLKQLSTDRSDLASTPDGLTRLAWRGTSMAVIGLQRTAIADLDIVGSRLGDGIFDFGDGGFYALQGFAYFVDGQWGRASIALELARASTGTRLAPVTSAVLPLSGLITGDRERTDRELKTSSTVLFASPQPAAVWLHDMVEVFALALLGSPEQRAGWRQRRIDDFGIPELGPDASFLWCVAHCIAAGWAGRPDIAVDWAPALRALSVAPWAESVASWLDAMSADDARFVELLEPISQAGIPGSPVLDALLDLEVARRAGGTTRRDARARSERLIAGFGGERVLLLLFPDDADEASPARTEANVSVLAPLSEREREIATLLLEGLSYAQIGRELFITRSTVSFHLTRIYAKTGTTSRHELAEATRLAPRLG